jgi:hypothetical protein
MVDARYLRNFAARLRRIKTELAPPHAPQNQRVAAELEAMARHFNRWADDLEGKPKENGEDQPA